MPDSAGASTFLKSEESGPRIVPAGAKLVPDSASGRKVKTDSMFFFKTLKNDLSFVLHFVAKARMSQRHVK